MLKGFKEFMMRGNIIDLATAVVIGTAFTTLVTAFTNAVITPLVARIGADKNSDIGWLEIPLGGDEYVNLNEVLSACINFFLIALVVYFVIVLPYNTLRRRGEVEPAEVVSQTEVDLLVEIRDLLVAQSKTPTSSIDTAAAPSAVHGTADPRTTPPKQL
ncbi:MAG: large-conductance mechanosensitive channel protein MscL [Mycobacterium sp.]